MIGYGCSHNTAQRNYPIDYSCSCTGRQWNAEYLNHGVYIESAEAVIEVSEVEGGEGDVAGDEDNENFGSISGFAYKTL